MVPAEPAMVSKHGSAARLTVVVAAAQARRWTDLEGAFRRDAWRQLQTQIARRRHGLEAGVRARLELRAPVLALAVFEAATFRREYAFGTAA